MKKIRCVHWDPNGFSQDAAASAIGEPISENAPDPGSSVNEQDMARRIEKLSRKLSAQSLVANEEMDATLQDGLYTKEYP